MILFQQMILRLSTFYLVLKETIIRVVIIPKAVVP